MRHFIKIHLILLFFCVFSLGLTAQVTTSGISGRVVSDEGPIFSATVVAVHTPTGTIYGNYTNSEGRFNLTGLRVGGPYNLKVTLMGYKTVEIKEIYLELGKVVNYTVTLVESVTELDEIIVQSTKGQAKQGVSTSVSSRQLTTLPTINRSITDFTKLSPFAGGRNSFAGRDGRYNNITIDGASLNNSFGLSTNNLPGGDAQPVPLDAIEEISVNVSPFDVKFSNFTGASINVVTKGGTNTLKGSGYSFIRPKNFTGSHIGDIQIENAKSRSSQTYGFTLGGAIIKNKLFFFLNGEIENQSFPGVQWSASNDGKDDITKKISRTTLADMKIISDHVNDKYGYDPGVYSNYPMFGSNNWKLMGRLDYNINDNHKMMIRFNKVASKNDVLVNPSSAPYANKIARVGQNSMAFANSSYIQHNFVTSITGELNSKFSSSVSNKFLATYTSIEDRRESLGEPFPFIDIYKDKKQYMSLGTELFSTNNQVKNNVLSLVNNLNISANKHFITLGASFEHHYFRNSYLRYALGYYRYNSVEDFMNDKQPSVYGLTYGYNNNDAPGANLNFGMFGLYAQDDWFITNDFKLTYGIRLDMPSYFDKLTPNNAILDYTFAEDRKVDVSKFPKTKLQFSPRLGFRYDVFGEGDVIVSGGTGLFTGLLPFVWFTNQPSNSGTIQNMVELGIADTKDIRFKQNYKDILTDSKLSSYFPASSNKAPGALAFVDPDFKMPQVWRNNISFEFKLPANFDLSLNALYTRDIYNVVQHNVNEAILTKQLDGADNRFYFGKNENRINKSFSNAMMLTNGKEKGYQYSLNTTLSKRFDKGLSGFISYTYSQARDLTANPGASANSAWRSNVAVNSLNDPGLSYSAFSTPHRVTANISYELSFCKYAKSTFSIFYSGYHTGRVSYTFGNDFNGDGAYSDLLYIPNSKEELTFVDKKNKKGEVTYVADEAREDFWNFVENTPYLNSRKGKYAERFGDLRPWLNRFDFKFAQSIYPKVGDRKLDLQLTLDILNMGNLINSKWGTYKTNGLMNYDNASILSGNIKDGKATYTMNVDTRAKFKDYSVWKDNIGTSSTWGMLLGLKLAF